MVSFLYPFMNFLQPGILWPEIADYKPMLLASVVALAFGLGKKSTYSRGPVFQHAVFVSMALFLLAQVLSLYQGGVWSILEEFGFWYVYALFVTISVLLMRDTESLRRYVWGMMFGSMFIVGYGVYSVSPWGWGGYLPHGQPPSGRAGAYGMYDNHNDYSFIIIQVVPFLFMYMRHEKGFIKTFLLAASLAACVLGTFLSLSRGGMLAFLFQGVLIILIGMEGRRRLWLLPVIAVISVAAITYQYAKRAENQYGDYTAEDAESSRLELWKAGMAMTVDHPFLGVGSRRFAEYAPLYRDLGHDLKGKVSHNTYVEVISGSGTFGFIPFVLMLYHLIKGLRIKGGPGTAPIVEATRKAALIGISGVVVRAFLDAKPHDWSIYVICAISLACFGLRTPAATLPPKSASGAKRRPGPTGPRRQELATAASGASTPPQALSPSSVNHAPQTSPSQAI